MRNRGLLLDRDGVINEDHGYVGSPETFTFMPNVFPFLRAARNNGYRLALVTNQSGVARGLYTQADFDALTAHMNNLLKKEGIFFDRVLACFTHPKGTPGPLSRDSYWRKPNPGMLLEAALMLDLDVTRSLFIGDKLSDVEAARAAQIKTVFLLSSDGPDIQGVHRIATLEQALPFFK